MGIYKETVWADCQLREMLLIMHNTDINSIKTSSNFLFKNKCDLCELTSKSLLTVLLGRLYHQNLICVSVGGGFDEQSISESSKNLYDIQKYLKNCLPSPIKTLKRWWNGRINRKGFVRKQQWPKRGKSLNFCWDREIPRKPPAVDSNQQFPEYKSRWIDQPVRWINIIVYEQTGGHAVAWLVEALCYKLEGPGFDSRWGHWIFQFT
jgi:hypothetical protein